MSLWLLAGNDCVLEATESELSRGNRAGRPNRRFLATPLREIISQKSTASRAGRRELFPDAASGTAGGTGRAMHARTNIRNGLPSRHVTAAPDSALSAMAREAGGGFGRAFAVEIFKKTPGVAGLKPGGRDVAKDIVDCGVINVEAGTLDVKLTGAERAQRKTKRASRATNPGSGALWKVAQQAGSAVDGAVTTRVAHARSSVMRTSRRTIFAFVLGAIPLAPAFAFDGTPVNAPARQAAPLGVVSAPAANAAPTGNKPVPPAAVPNAGAAATTMASNAASSQVVALEYAAEGGHPVAQWKLGRIFLCSETQHGQ